MQLSIVIVNYNSKLLLENCLVSIEKAIEEIETEIIIVDNNSTDGSRELPSKFPDLTFIFNHENLGFAKACNQGFKVASGKYVLFLNPDAILSETSLTHCLAFFETHPDAGAVGVRMIDSKKRFLKESKRGFPTPSASFHKLFGLSAIFPKSKLSQNITKGICLKKKIIPLMF